MKIVIFGLSVSSSWGNGHATIWRGLIRGLTEQGHLVTFFEKNVPYYEANRDFNGLQGLDLVLYNDWDEIIPEAYDAVESSDVSIVTSYCPDARKISKILHESTVFSVFYDLDTPVTLHNIESGIWPDYIGSDLHKYDLVLSYTGGTAVDKLKDVLSAKRVVPLYGCADPLLYGPIVSLTDETADLSYLGTFALDRQKKLEELFLRPAECLPGMHFLIAGAQYPSDLTFGNNITFKEHISPPDHSEFYCSSRFTLNITRSAMAKMGYCPSGRLFEAALCGVPIISDRWEGIEEFFEPEEEIILVDRKEDVISALSMPEEKRNRIALAAKTRIFTFHTSEKRARELIGILEEGKE